MRCSKSIGLCLLAAATGCSSPHGDVEVRAISSAPKSQGLAYAEAQLALGNVATALEGFRKAIREDPQNIQAALGIARAYDGMGRFDVSRRWYETALASAPDDPAVLSAFASSLERQGMMTEAASVRAEAAQRAALDAAAERLVANAAEDGDEPLVETAARAPIAATVQLEGAPAVAIRASGRPLSVPKAEFIMPQPEQVAATASQHSVTVRLPAPTPAPVARQEVAQTLAKSPKRESAGPRLERLSMGEVALVTKAKPVWTAQLASSSSRNVTFRWVAVRPTARLLNAARNQGLAARTRAHLMDRGWKRIEIGDAPAVRSKTLVLYPAFRRATAQRLAAQFGFSELKPFNGSEIVVLLGRDAAAMKALRPA